MFLNKEQKAIDKQIMQGATPFEPNKSLTIDVKLRSPEQLFSQYCGTGDKLDPELGEYIYAQCAQSPFADKVEIRFRTDNADGDAAKKAVKDYITDEYRDAKKAIRRNTVLSLIMTACGIAILALLFALSYFFDNAYVDTVLEIAAWVFIWEAVDIFFFERSKLKAKRMILLKLYSAEISVTSTDNE